MFVFTIKRILSVLPVLVLVAIIVFALVRIGPGDPAAIIAGDSATTAQIEAIRHEMGLDQPMTTQFISWTKGLIKGDFGDSLISGRPVLQLIGKRLGPTLALAFYTIVYVLLLSIPLGIIAAARRGKGPDQAVSVGSVIGFSVPVFIVEYLLIYVFALKLKWFPVQGYYSFGEGLGTHLWHIVLPVIGLSALYIALVTRFVRTSVIDILAEDYVRTAHAKGLRERYVLTRHALPNASVPILTIVGVALTMLVAGVVVTETVFNIPGIGRLVVEAIQAKDYPVIQAIIILLSVFNVLINLIIDISYKLIDPRIEI